VTSRWVGLVFQTGGAGGGRAGQGGDTSVYLCRFWRAGWVQFVSVANRSGFSAQTLAVLAELCSTPTRWQHGYGIARDTGLKSGTLYPILIRLADRGLIEARWEDEQPAGRPRRHLYRLTAGGLAAAEAALAEVGEATVVDRTPERRGARRVAARVTP
jgi:PadR family transcriptional regulator PadR